MTNKNERARVMVVHPEPIIRMVLEDMIAGHGEEVLLADLGINIERRIRYERPDIVMLPRCMGTVCAVDVARRMRAEHGNGAPRLVLIAEDPHADRVAAWKTPEIDDVVMQPLKPDDLFRCLEGRSA